MTTLRQGDNELVLNELKLTIQVKTKKETEPQGKEVTSMGKPSSFLDFKCLVANNDSYTPAENDRITSILRQLGIANQIWDEMLEIHHRCLCNAYSIGVDGDFSARRTFVGRAIYIKGSFFNHSCRPNVFFQQKPGTAIIQFLTFGTVRVGEPLNLSYIPTLIDYLSRQELLLEEYKFNCGCMRCEEDKEEFKQTMEA